MPRVKFFPFLVVLLVLFLASSPAFAQRDTMTNTLQNNLSVTGTVYMGDMAHPAANIMMHVYVAEGSDLADVSTNEAGGFNIYSLKPAIYTIDIDVSGFRRSTTSVDMQFGSVRNVQITLIPAADSNATKKAGTVSSHELSIPAKAREELQSGRLKLYERNDPAGALEDFNLALATAPGYYEAEYESARAYLAQEKRTTRRRVFRNRST